MHKVFKSDDNWFFSKGVSRSFGGNKIYLGIGSG